MIYKEFALTIEPTTEEVTAYEADVKNHMVVPVRGNPKGPAAARASKTFQARAYRLWLELTNPSQIGRNAEAHRLESLGGTRWFSENGKHDRVYFADDTGFYDVNTGETKAT